MKNCINSLELSDLNSNSQSALLDHYSKLAALQHQCNIKWAQRARFLWIKDGVHQFFHNLWNVPSNVTLNIAEALPPDLPRISDSDNINLIQDFTKEEVYCALSELPLVVVVSIDGMGDLGKTTLAQLVYRDEEVQKHFQLHIWVCVLDDFDMPKLAGNIIHTVSGKKYDDTDMEVLQQRLRKELGEKKYLLVLDDVLNEDFRKWDALRNMLLDGGEGSRILVTTHNEKCSRVMGAPKPPKLVEIGEKIVEKCQGLPLAIEVMGSIMHDKSEEEDHDIEEVELIQLWMAHGFVASQKGNDMEVEGQEIFSKADCSTIRTVLYCRYDSSVLSRLKFVRVLDLSHTRIKEFLGSIEHLHHLRYLDLSWTNIRKLPESIYFKALPVGLSQLPNLKTLTRYTVGDDAENNIGQLNPFGKLALDNLERVQNADDSRKADIGDFGPPFPKSLEVSGSDALRELPTCPTSLQYLRNDKCRGMESLGPEIRHITSLSRLNLSSYPKLVSLPNGMQALTSFKYLHIIDCSTLKSFPEGLQQLLPTLKELIINGCAELERSIAECSQFKYVKEVMGKRLIQALGDNAEHELGVLWYQSFHSIHLCVRCSISWLCSKAVNMAANGMPPLLMFDGEDYGVWSIMMRTLFHSQDLWDLIDKGIPEDEE
ncbi:putative disease resistance protein RGA4 [Dioscorea cayenensis subsp. rotundata]|uniref:Disease resistance protein RGA4 n=1 Tax=Dioscorea cayennensis subsp. rotundata TaxID=55577 RepID=A0AB40ASH6_DIOCR|nr:putative disease resistance protein RGA4 [Dioscorea cayenensis subsp. rotundata]